MWQMDRAVRKDNSQIFTSTGQGGREVQLAEKCKEGKVTKTRDKIVAVNECGRRIGASHPRAKLTDEEVDWIRELAEPEVDVDGKVIRRGLSHREIAKKFEINRGHVGKVVRCDQRGQVASQYRRVKKARP